MNILKLFLVAAVILLFPGTASAYIGPGIGVGTIGVMLGLLVSVFLAFAAVIWHPVKQLFKRKKKGENDQDKKPVE